MAHILDTHFLENLNGNGIWNFREPYSDMGEDGCLDGYEDGNGGCLESFQFSYFCQSGYSGDLVQSDYINISRCDYDQDVPLQFPPLCFAQTFRLRNVLIIFRGVESLRFFHNLRKKS